MIRQQFVPMNRWLEPLFAAGIMVLNLYSLWHLYTYSYLPQPYFYVPEDTWMDWFNTAYWAHQPGAYDSWKTIYPPLSFVVLKPLTWGACYVAAEGYASRQCDWYGAATLHLVFLANLVLIAKAFAKIDRSTQWPRTVALGLGLPMTFALERGNLILLCFTCLLLAFGPLVRSARLRWLFAGLAINFKVYLIGAVFAQLLHRRWRWFEGAVLATVLVYLVTYAIVGDGLPSTLVNNIRDFSTQWEASTPLDLWYTVTYQPALSLIESKSFPLVPLIGSYTAELLLVALPVAVYTVQATIAAAAVLTFFNHRLVSRRRAVLLSIAFALVISEAGGYTQILLLLFVFWEKWKGLGPKVALLCAYVLCLPFDIAMTPLPENATVGALATREVITRYDVGYMQLLRPGIILLMCWALSLSTIFDVIRGVARNRAEHFAEGGDLKIA